MHDFERKAFRREAARLHAEIVSGKSVRKARFTRPEPSLPPRRYRDDDNERGRGERGQGPKLTP